MRIDEVVVGSFDLDTMRLLAPCDAGRRLGITTSGVIKLARRGVLRDLRDSRGRRFFEEQEVDRLVRERKARKGAKAKKRCQSAGTPSVVQVSLDNTLQAPSISAAKQEAVADTRRYAHCVMICIGGQTNLASVWSTREKAKACRRAWLRDAHLRRGEAVKVLKFQLDSE